MSNWERRPLRKSQQHYAALDAYILVMLIHKLAEKGKEEGNPLDRFIVSLDKRTYIPKDEDEFGEGEGIDMEQKPVVNR